MQKTFGKDSDEWKFFGEFWKMIQAYYVPDKSDEYWDSLIEQANQLFNKYKGNLFIYKMIKAFLDYADRALKGEQPPSVGRTVITITVKPKSQDEGNMDVTEVSQAK